MHATTAISQSTAKDAKLHKEKSLVIFLRVTSCPSWLTEQGPDPGSETASNPPYVLRVAAEHRRFAVPLPVRPQLWHIPHPCVNYVRDEIVPQVCLHPIFLRLPMRGNSCYPF